ncbi:MAG: excinuclease ABC subunit UvrC [Thermoplasmata archaeon]|nr:excinuclease ABC subunit UvrC [Thermoplasmata archaeon]
MNGAEGPGSGFVPASRWAYGPEQRFRPGPDSPGVYLFRGPEGEVVYVGKSKHLRRRVLDHLKVRVEKDEWIVGRSTSVEFVPTANEREALLLEATLTKQYQPPYNTLLKDDRSYPYIAVTMGETFPRILVVRRPRRGGGTILFGPYTGAREARGVARLLSETFQIRRCVRLPKRACLYFYLQQCTAPCVGLVDRPSYRAQVDDALTVLRGHGQGISASFEAQMKSAAQHQEFERAARLRDALRGLRALEERQHVVGPGAGRVDVVAVVLPRNPGTLRVSVGVLRIEDGEVRQSEPHVMGFPADDPPEPGELLRQFLTQYYGPQSAPPSRIYIAGPRPDGVDEAVDWLEKDLKIQVRFSPTGRPASLVRLATRLATSTLDQLAPATLPRDVLRVLMDLLRLPRLPSRIEGIDISIFQGSEAVGSLVVFQNGQPLKDEYRRFRIRTVQGMNDFAMVAEVVRRRLRRLMAEAEKLPDLLLIDGGAGQVAAACSVVHELGLQDEVPVVGLAKREEELYFPDRKGPMAANPNSPPMLLLRAVRDEAHRFAVTYHRTRRRMGLRQEMEEASAELHVPGPSPGPA